MTRQYIAIDLKSFYASVECNERGLDPMTTNLVVADPSRTEKTICLAVSPSLKACGISGRPRLFEVIQQTELVNAKRRKLAPKGSFTGESYDSEALKAHPEYAISYLTAPPRMAYYLDYSAKIYGIYLNYIAPEDIHVYSIDEVFMDVTDYLKTYGMSAHELAMTMIRDVLRQTGITATAGIGTNLYLAKIAMDVVAKKMPADQDGVRIAELDEISYRKSLWDHKPLSDFWRVGKGIRKKLEEHRMFTMGDIAKMSLTDTGEDLLYRLFGVNAELLIDHAWGWEPCTIEDIKAYQPKSNSISSGQVLSEAYPSKKARLIAHEMADQLAIDLFKKKLITDQITLTIGYDAENLKSAAQKKAYQGAVKTDHYGRRIPKHAHGTKNLDVFTSSGEIIEAAVLALFDEIADPKLSVRRLTLGAHHVLSEDDKDTKTESRQLSFFDQPTESSEKEKEERERERRKQKAVSLIQERFGKNAILRGMNLEEGATQALRNKQIGGHKA